MRTVSLALVGVAICVGPAGAANVSISNAWFRALPANLPAAGYFELRNPGTAPVNLTGADSPACGMLMLHKSEEKGGVGSMEDVSGVEIPAGGKVAFAPGGYHLMCTNPGPAMKPGGKVPVRLEFSDGTAAAEPFAVRNAAGK